MPNLPEATVTPVVEEPGFTFVEEDDVAFTLALCREIHRLYGDYHESELPADEQVWAGLDLTRRMVLSLQSTVTAGMPAMRLEVAASQTREMMTVLFGQETAAKRPRLRSSDVARDSLAAARSRSQAELLAPQPALPPAPATAAAASRSDPGPSTQHLPIGVRLLALWNRQAAAARLVIGFTGCVLLGALMTLPVAIMALYPSDLTELGLAYALIGIAGWQWNRRSAHRPAASHRRPLTPA